jgi:hypothetical protein
MFSPIFTVNTRAALSTALPAAKGMIILTGFCGYAVWAEQIAEMHNMAVSRIWRAGRAGIGFFSVMGLVI